MLQIQNKGCINYVLIIKIERVNIMFCVFHDAIFIFRIFSEVFCSCFFVPPVSLPSGTTRVSNGKAPPSCVQTGEHISHFITPCSEIGMPLQLCFQTARTKNRKCDGSLFPCVPLTASFRFSSAVVTLPNYFLFSCVQSL